MNIEKRVERMERGTYKTERWMYRCAIIGIADILLGILSLYLDYPIAAGIFFLIAIRQAVVFPKWRKKLKEEKEAKNGKQ